MLTKHMLRKTLTKQDMRTLVVKTPKLSLILQTYCKHGIYQRAVWPCNPVGIKISTDTVDIKRDAAGRENHHSKFKHLECS